MSECDEKYTAYVKVCNVPMESLFGYGDTPIQALENFVYKINTIIKDFENTKKKNLNHI